MLVCDQERYKAFNLEWCICWCSIVNGVVDVYMYIHVHVHVGPAYSDIHMYMYVGVMCPVCAS